MNRSITFTVRIISCTVILIFLAATAKSQIIEGQTPSPCKVFIGGDRVQSLPYAGNPPSVLCSQSPVDFVEPGIQGFGEGPISFFFPYSYKNAARRKLHESRLQHGRHVLLWQ